MDLSRQPLSEPTLLFDYSPLGSHLTFGVVDAQIQVKIQNLTADRRDVAFVFNLPAAEFGDAVVAAVDRQDAWSINRAGAGAFLATQKRSGPFKVGAAIAFTFDHLSPKGVKGDHLAITVAERVEGETTGKVALDVELVEAAASIDAFWAERIQIHPDERATLSWRTAGAQTVSLHWGSATRENLPLKVPDAEHSIKPEVMPKPPVGLSEITYTLRASTPTGWTVRSVTVSVATVEARLWAEPVLVKPGQKATLHWKTSNAVNATLDGKNLPKQELDSGQRDVLPGSDTVYALTAFGEGGSNVATALAKVAVGRFRILTFEADPPQPKLRKPVLLLWLTSFAEEVCITPGPGIVAGAGEVELHPTQPTTYTLRAVGPPQTPPIPDRRVAVPVPGYEAEWSLADSHYGAGLYFSRYPPVATGFLREGATVRTVGASDPRCNGVWSIRARNDTIRIVFVDNPPEGIAGDEKVQVFFGRPEERLAYDLVAVSAWTDSSKTAPVLFSGLHPSQRVWVQVTVLNTGVMAWTNTGPNAVDLVTFPKNRPSLFADPSWPGHRIDAAHLTEASVTSGKQGTYGFWITVAPRVVPGPYDEWFFLVRPPDAYFGEPFDLHAVIT